MQSAQSEVGRQVAAIKQVPGEVLAYWGGWFTFTIVHWIEAMVISAVPNVGGLLGTVVNAGLRGMTTTVDMVTWDKIRGQGPTSSGSLNIGS